MKKRTNHDDMVDMLHFNNALFNMMSVRLFQKMNEPKFYAVNTFLYSTYKSREINKWNLDKWFRKSIEDLDVIAIPIFDKRHWSLVMVVLDCSLMIHFDPVPGLHKTEQIGTILSKYFDDYGKLAKRIEWDIQAAKVPVQPNDTDCGMYICAYAEVFVSEWVRGEGKCQSNLRELVKSVLNGEKQEWFQHSFITWLRKRTKQQAMKNRTSSLTTNDLNCLEGANEINDRIISYFLGSLMGRVKR